MQFVHLVLPQTKNARGGKPTGVLNSICEEEQDFFVCAIARDKRSLLERAHLTAR